MSKLNQKCFVNLPYLSESDKELITERKCCGCPKYESNEEYIARLKKTLSKITEKIEKLEEKEKNWEKETNKWFDRYCKRKDFNENHPEVKKYFTIKAKIEEKQKALKDKFDDVWDTLGCMGVTAYQQRRYEGQPDEEYIEELSTEFLKIIRESKKFELKVNAWKREMNAWYDTWHDHKDLTDDHPAHAQHYEIMKKIEEKKKSINIKFTHYCRLLSQMDVDTVELITIGYKN
jgi:Asp-tRNA(Asn)/Glu-tRNA(Gln) amidotransferase C subunit